MYLYREYLKAEVYTMWVHGPFEYNNLGVSNISSVPYIKHPRRSAFHAAAQGVEAPQR